MTAKIHGTAQLVMRIKNQFQKINDNNTPTTKWKKLESQFFSNFERFRDITTSINDKFKATEPRQPKRSISHSDKLLDQNGHQSKAYGTSSAANESLSTNSQDMLFRPYDELYELENYEEKLYEILQNLQLLYETHLDLNTLIHDQDEVVDQLQDNVAEAKEEIEAGTQHLDKAAAHQKAYRGKLCVFLGVLLVIAVIVTVVVILNRKQ